MWFLTKLNGEDHEIVGYPMESEIEDVLSLAGTLLKKNGGSAVIMALMVRRKVVDNQIEAEKLIESVEDDESKLEDLEQAILYAVFEAPFKTSRLFEQFFACTPDGPAIGKFEEFITDKAVPFSEFLPIIKEAYENS